MNPFTKEQMERLAPIEDILGKAQNDYYSALFHDQKTLVQEVYQAAGGERSISWGCGRCWLAVLKDMGDQYFRQKAEAEKKAAEKPKKAPAKKTAKKAE